MIVEVDTNEFSQILAKELDTDESGKRIGMSYLIHLSDSDSEVQTEFWIIVKDDGALEIVKMLDEANSPLPSNVTKGKRVFPFGRAKATGFAPAMPRLIEAD